MTWHRWKYTVANLEGVTTEKIRPLLSSCRQCDELSNSIDENTLLTKWLIQTDKDGATKFAVGNSREQLPTEKRGIWRINDVIWSYNNWEIYSYLRPTSDQSLLVRPYPCIPRYAARWEELNALNRLQNKYDSYCSQPQDLTDGKARHNGTKTIPYLVCKYLHGSKFFKVFMCLKHYNVWQPSQEVTRYNASYIRAHDIKGYDWSKMNSDKCGRSPTLYEL